MVQCNLHSYWPNLTVCTMVSPVLIMPEPGRPLWKAEVGEGRREPLRDREARGDSQEPPRKVAILQGSVGHGFTQTEAFVATDLCP